MLKVIIPIIGLVVFMAAGCAPSIVTFRNRFIETTLPADFAESCASETMIKAGRGRDVFQADLYSTSTGDKVTEQNWDIVEKDRDGHRYLISVVTLPDRPTRIMVLSESNSTAQWIFNDILQQLKAKK